MLQEIAKNKFLKALEKIEYGTLTLMTPEDKVYKFIGCDTLHVTIQVYNWAFITSIVAKGDVGAAESYRKALFETDNIANLCTLALKNGNLVDRYLYGNSLFNMIEHIKYYFQSNTLKGSKRNIHAHYDLGNEFYSLWLDPTMTYSSAIFKNKHETLQQGQSNKYDRILDTIGNNSGSLLEIGCGWGGFADHIVTRNDMDIKGITISNAQYDFAKNRLAGNKNVNITLEDYRIQTGLYDYIVSIEMFEAVGEKFWSIYFDKVKSLLKQKGKAIIQTITIDDRYFAKYKKTTDIFRTFIFPGGMLPSLEKFKTQAAQAGLQTIGYFNFGQDYARTLQCWLNVFDSKQAEMKAMNFDCQFMRLWRFYLSACIAGFVCERTNVMQIELTHLP